MSYKRIHTNINIYTNPLFRACARGRRAKNKRLCFIISRNCLYCGCTAIVMLCKITKTLVQKRKLLDKAPKIKESP